MSAQHQQRRCGVAGLGFPERRHPVADRLDTGQRRAAGRERTRDQEHHREPEHLAVFGVHLETRRFGAQWRAEHIDLEQPPGQHDVHADHERVGGNRERGARLADAAQVHRRQHQDRDDSEQHLVLSDERHRRADVRHRRGHRHRNREHVIHEQRAGHCQARGVAEIGRDDLVVAAAGRVGVHVLPVAGDDDQHDRGDGQPDPRRHRVGGQARDREHQEDFLRRVGHRRQRVGREDRQRDPLG